MAIFNSFLYVYQRVFVLGINHKSPDPGRGDRGSLHRDWGFFLPPEIDPNNSRPARIGKPYGIAGVRTSTIFLMIFLLNRKNIIQKQSGKKGQALSLEQIRWSKRNGRGLNLAIFLPQHIPKAHPMSLGSVVSPPLDSWQMQKSGFPWKRWGKHHRSIILWLFYLFWSEDIVLEYRGDIGEKKLGITRSYVNAWQSSWWKWGAKPLSHIVHHFQTTWDIEMNQNRGSNPCVPGIGASYMCLFAQMTVLLFHFPSLFSQVTVVFV